MAVSTPTLTQRLAAEFLGTFVLVLGGCGSAVLAAIFLADRARWASGTSGSRSRSASPC
jgi:glycerol uptake facilitator-like aquaporin